MSDLLTPPLTLPIVEVLKYDTEHDAWEVETRTTPSIGEGSADSTMWVRKRTSGHPAPNATWKLYDIGTPLAKEAR